MKMSRNTTLKRFLAFLLAFTMILGIVPASVFAAEYKIDLTEAAFIHTYPETLTFDGVTVVDHTITVETISDMANKAVVDIVLDENTAADAAFKAIIEAVGSVVYIQGSNLVMNNPAEFSLKLADGKATTEIEAQLGNGWATKLVLNFTIDGAEPDEPVVPDEPEDPFMIIMDGEKVGLTLIEDFGDNYKLYRATIGEGDATFKAPGSTITGVDALVYDVWVELEFTSNADGSITITNAELAKQLQPGEESFVCFYHETEEFPDGINFRNVYLTRVAAEKDPALVEAIAQAKAELVTYKDPADYREAQQAELAEAIAAGQAAIDAAEDLEAVEKALADAKAAIDEIPTDAELTEAEKPSVEPTTINVVDAGNNLKKPGANGYLKEITISDVAVKEWTFSGYSDADKSGTFTITLDGQTAKDATVAYQFTKQVSMGSFSFSGDADSAGAGSVQLADGKATVSVTTTFGMGASSYPSTWILEFVVDGAEEEPAPVKPEGWYEVTVKAAPETADVTFYYGHNMDAQLEDEYVFDEGVVEGYHQYKIWVPEGKYSYTAVEGEQYLGGMAFDVPIDDEVLFDPSTGGGVDAGNGQVLKLRRYNVYTTHSAITSIGDYTVKMIPRDRPQAENGTQYIDENGRVVTPLMLQADGNAVTYQLHFDINGELGESYAGSSQDNQTYGMATTTGTIQFSVGGVTWYTVTAPKEAKTQMFNQLNNYNVVELYAKKQEDLGDGTVKYSFPTPGGTGLTYRVSMEGKITKAGYASSNKNIVVTFAKNEDPKTTQTTAQRKEAGTLLNINSQNNLSLKVGETFRLRSFRAWQIINTDPGNIMIEPDFNYNIISGAEHVQLTPANNKVTGNAGTGMNTNWMDIKALSAGTVVLEVTYDAIEIAGSSQYNGIFGATHKDRAGIVVIQIGAGKNEPTFEITPEGKTSPIDAEFFTYYFEGETAPLNFTATMNGQAIDKVELSTDLGKTWTEVAYEDGMYRAEGLVHGHNLFRATTGDEVQYHTFRATDPGLTVTNLSRVGEGVIEGEKVRVHFTNIYTPIPKMSGIYNPGFGVGHQVKYNYPEGVSVSLEGSQYGFMADNGMTITFSETGTYTFEAVGVPAQVLGDEAGQHRALTDSGRGTNFNARATNTTHDILPDLTFEVIEDPVIAVSFTSEPDGAEFVVKDMAGNVIEAEEGVYNLGMGKYQVKATKEGYIPKTDIFNIVFADSATGEKVVNVELTKIEGEGIWDGTDPGKSTDKPEVVDGVYQIGTAKELVWFAKYHNSEKAVLTADISLGGTVSFRMIQNYGGVFDGQGHYIYDLYINTDSGYGNGLFANPKSGAVIKNLGVTGEVIATGQYAYYTGGIVGSGLSNAKLTIENCVSRVNVSSKGRYTGGIVGGATSGSSANYATIKNSYNSGTVQGEGIIGGGDTTNFNGVKHCYSYGNVTGYGISASTRGSVGNNYVLAGSAKSKNSAGTEVSSDTLKTTKISEAYILNPTEYNEGYPVLAWEAPRLYAYATLEQAIQIAEAEFATIDTDEYREAEAAQIKALIADCTSAFPYAQSAEDIQRVRDALFAEVAKLKTDAQLDAEEELAALNQAKADAIAEIESYKNPDDYRPAQQEELAEAIAAGKAAINAAPDIAGVNTAKGEAKAAMDAIKTKAEDITLGDIDNDGSINMTDVSMVLQYVNGSELTEEQALACDVDGDGSVNMTDVSLVLQYVNGVITVFPAEE